LYMWIKFFINREKKFSSIPITQSRWPINWNFFKSESYDENDLCYENWPWPVAERPSVGEEGQVDAELVRSGRGNLEPEIRISRTSFSTVIYGKQYGQKMFRLNMNEILLKMNVDWWQISRVYICKHVHNGTKIMGFIWTFLFFVM
jgi:hypothetical protein